MGKDRPCLVETDIRHFKSGPDLKPLGKQKQLPKISWRLNIGTEVRWQGNNWREAQKTAQCGVWRRNVVDSLCSSASQGSKRAIYMNDRSYLDLGKLWSSCL